jgi:hypothetical protein
VGRAPHAGGRTYIYIDIDIYIYIYINSPTALFAGILGFFEKVVSKALY